MTRPELTTNQERVLAVIRSWSRTHGWAPSLREICQAIGVSSPATARGHLLALERKGYIQRGHGARTLRTVY